MAESMIERVARAILKARFYDCEPDMYNGLDGFYHEIDEEHVEDARREARDAIKAMREPTDAMVDAALGATGIYEDGSNDYLVHYRSMIDAALLEQQP